MRTTEPTIRQILNAVTYASGDTLGAIASMLGTARGETREMLDIAISNGLLERRGGGSVQHYALTEAGRSVTEPTNVRACW